MESRGASQGCSIQQSHAKDIQHLEAEAIEEERRDCLAFLAACSTTLRASPPEAHGIMVTPFYLLLGNAPTYTLLNIPPGVSLLQQEPALQTTPASATIAPWSSPLSKGRHNSPDWVEPPFPLETTSKVTPEEPPIQSGRRKCSSTKPCQGVARKLSAGIPNWCRQVERNTTGKTTCTLTMKPHVTWQMFSGEWSNLLAY